MGIQIIILLHFNIIIVSAFITDAKEMSNRLMNMGGSSRFPAAGNSGDSNRRHEYTKMPKFIEGARIKTNKIASPNTLKLK